VGNAKAARGGSGKKGGKLREGGGGYGGEGERKAISEVGGERERNGRERGGKVVRGGTGGEILSSKGRRTLCE